MILDHAGIPGKACRAVIQRKVRKGLKEIRNVFFMVIDKTRRKDFGETII